MPKLDTHLHLDMLWAYRQEGRPGPLMRLLSRLGLSRHEIYGLHWGDPESEPVLRQIRDHFVLPYVGGGRTTVEIGPGGGRWTRYLLACEKVYVVDFHQELLDELHVRFHPPNLVPIRNNGTDFPGVPPCSTDFLFSFDTFVHLDLEIIDQYLANMRAVLRPAAQVVIHYSDKTKPKAARNEGFSDNDPERMRRLVLARGFRIEEEDLASLPHSAVIRFCDRV